MKQDLKITAEVTKIREEGKKTINLFFDLGKGILFQRNEIHYASQITRKYISKGMECNQQKAMSKT